ncbi:inactive polyglycylase TTLL10 [Dryobates pubescens]|uniref:inactive polyglycylase TTLL10 n=1 Tax=Dryobates pubescens TaxID=118200 RepID=UPI0023B91FBD|nr:inactive polyglycylase TTLL10 [Dryobates pubescens]
MAASTTSEVELDKGKSNKSKTEGKASPQEQQPEEETPQVPEGPGPYFYLSGSNGAELVSSYCQGRGWQRIYDNRREDYALKWCEIKDPESYQHFKEGKQLLYQIPNNRVLTTKTGLLCCLREQERRMEKSRRSSKFKFLKMEEFFPESFRLDIEEERNSFLKLCRGEEIWICKPSCSNQGKGIFLLKGPAALDSLQAKLHSTEEQPPKKKVLCKAPPARIVQRYIHQPLLLEGKKFDVRAYLLIACTAPFLVLFAQGYARLTCGHYDPASEDLTVHLTNQYMQKKHPLYSQLKEETVWGMEHLNSYLNEKFRGTSGLPADWVFTVLTERMKQIVLQCFLAAQHKLARSLGYFDLIGCDFLVDEHFKVWLLEMNSNPALHTNCRVLRDIIPAVVHECLDLVLEVFMKRLKGQNLLPLETLRHFVLLYHEDAEALSQKSPSKLRAGQGRGRYLQPQRSNVSWFGQGPAKVLLDNSCSRLLDNSSKKLLDNSSTKLLDNSSKKLPCPRKEVAVLPKKEFPGLLTLPQVQLFNQDGKPF